MTADRRAAARSQLARFVLAAVLVGGLSWIVGPASILETLAHADAGLLVAAFLAVVAYSALRAWTWQQLLVALGIIARSQHLRDVAGCYAAGAFVGTVLPSTAGTDAVRALLAQRRFGGPLSRHLAAIVVLNAVSWLTACVLGLVALAVFYDDELRVVAFFAAPLFAGIAAGILGTYWLLRYQRRAWLALLRKVPRPLRRVRRALRRFAASLLVLARARVRVGPVLASALLAQLGVAAMLSLVAASVGIELRYLFWVVYAPLVSMVAFVPASVSGFGADQAAFVYVLGWVGVGQSQAFVASALGSILKLFFNVACGALAFVLRPVEIENLSHNQ